MIGIVIHVTPPEIGRVEIELLLHRIAIHEKHIKPVPEETKTAIFPQPPHREETLFVISKILHSVPLNIRKFAKQNNYKTFKESRQCIACLVDTQQSLTRLASVCEKPPEKI